MAVAVTVPAVAAPSAAAATAAAAAAAAATDLHRLVSCDATGAVVHCELVPGLEFDPAYPAVCSCRPHCICALVTSLPLVRARMTIHSLNLDCDALASFGRYSGRCPTQYP